MMWRGRRFWLSWCAAVVVTSAAVMTAMLGEVAPTTAAWNQGVITHSVASMRTAALGAQMTTPAGTCNGTPATSTCSGQLVPPGPMQGGGVYIDSTLRNTNPAGSGNYTQSIQVSACAPLQFANGAAGTPLLSRGGVTRQVAGPWGATTAARFDGVNDLAAGAVGFPSAAMATNSFSFGVWFRADAGSTGNSLVGGSSSPGSVPNAFRGATPALQLAPDNRVRFEYIAAQGGQVGGFSSPGFYRDGRWHFAVMVVDRGSSNPTFQMWADGVKVAEVPAVALAPYPAGESAYWHVGWVDPARSIFNSAPFFNGDLSGAFLWSGRALTGAEIGALYTAPAADAYGSQLVNATGVWMLGDARDSTYSGPIPYVTGGNPCGHMLVHPFSGGTQLLAPSNVAALVTQSNGGTVWSNPVPAPGPGQSATIRFWASREQSSVYDTDVTLMEVRIRYAHRLQMAGTSWTASMSWSDNYVQL